MSDPQSQQLWSDGLAHTVTKPVIAVVMGVSGSGKTTVSVLLSSALGCQFQEGDDLHPALKTALMNMCWGFENLAVGLRATYIKLEQVEKELQKLNRTR